MVSLNDHDNAKREFEAISNTYSLLLGAETGKLDVPTEQTVEFPGDEDEARESAEYIAAAIEEAGYTVTLEYLGTRESITEDDSHAFTMQVE